MDDRVRGLDEQVSSLHRIKKVDEFMKRTQNFIEAMTR